MLNFLSAPPQNTPNSSVGLWMGRTVSTNPTYALLTRLAMVASLILIIGHIHTNYQSAPQSNQLIEKRFLEPVFCCREGSPSLEFICSQQPAIMIQPPAEEKQPVVSKLSKTLLKTRNRRNLLKVLCPVLLGVFGFVCTVIILNSEDKERSKANEPI